MKAPYYGGTGITLEKLKEKLHNTINVDGTSYSLDTWLKECAVFEGLIPGKSKVWIPYGGMMKHGKLNRIEWVKFTLEGTGYADAESHDWWIYEPILIVDGVSSTGENYEYYVYEYTLYYENFSLWKNMQNKYWYVHLFRRAKYFLIQHLKYKH